MDLGGFVSALTTFDYVLLILLAGAFVVGFVQGAVRQLLSMLALLLAFVVAAALRTPLGDFLGQYWTALAPGFSRLIAFGLLFLLVFVIAQLLIQMRYRPAPLVARWALADDIGGGVLGVVLGLLMIAAVVMINDSFYATRPVGDNGQVEWIADLAAGMRDSAIVNGLRSTVIPVLVTILGPLGPGTV
jgi:uncharacterized membrane protein required for colicin V production